MGLLFNTIGTIGVAFILIAYFLIQHGRITSAQIVFPVLNGVGALLILVSLYHMPNTPSIIIESFWLLISLYGFFRILRMRRNL